MSRIIGQVIVALLFFAAGVACWTLATVQRSISKAHVRLETLAAGAATAYGNIEPSMRFVRYLPRVGDSLVRDVRGYRTIADYWGANRASTSSPSVAVSTPDEQSPEGLFFAANAAFRASTRDAVGARVAVARLDSVAKRYALVLDKHPGHVDAAYNYEFVVRLRDRIARTRRAPLAAKSAAMKGDLPSGSTLHGHPGAPPLDPNTGQFEILVPMQSDESDMPPEGRNKQKRGKG